MRERLKKRLIYLGVLLVGLTSCSSNSSEGLLVAVEVGDLSTANLGESRLIAIDPEKPGKAPRILSEDFVSACAPSLSHEGRYLYFQGRKDAADPWQIWVMDMQKGSIQSVTDLQEDCKYPASLPDGTVIFSRSDSNTGPAQSSLYRCRMDGSELTRISFSPGNDTHPSVLDEGRVLYLSQQQRPETASPKLMIMRPDGSKSELYYSGYVGQQPISGGLESGEGYIYFIREGGGLSRVNHQRPLHSLENVSGKLSGQIAAVYPYGESKLLISYQPEGAEVFGLYAMKGASDEDPVLLYQSERDVTDPVWIGALKKRPKILPSAVNMEMSTGLLMSQNINHSMLPVHEDLQGDSLASRIRILSQNGTVGEVEVEADGSFYLVLDADTPVKMEALNRQGEVVRGPSDWIYLRPNERRACVGCHADHELAPDNTQPMAVKKEAVDLSTQKVKTSNPEEGEL